MIVQKSNNIGNRAGIADLLLCIFFFPFDEETTFIKRHRRLIYRTTGPYQKNTDLGHPKPTKELPLLNKE